MPLASDAAYREIKDWIQTGKIAPGGLIDEADAIDKLGMSRTPVREALLRLQSEGYLEIRRHKGIRVLPLSSSDMREMYQVISALETMAVSLIAKHRPDAEAFQPVNDALADMQDHLDAGDIDKWGLADERFHRELMRLSGNKKLYQSGCQMRDLAQRAHMVALRLQTDAYRQRSTRTHVKMIETLMSKRAPQAAVEHQAQRERGEDALVGIVEKFQLTSL